MAEEPVQDPSPLSLLWSFGVSSRRPSMVHSLEGGRRGAGDLFYAAANTGVVARGTASEADSSQDLLQAHTSPVTASAVSADKRVLVTADAGDAPLLVVWDASSALPVAVMEPEGGVAALALSGDGQTVFTLSNSRPQRLCVWRWAGGETEPAASAELNEEFEVQHCVSVNPVECTDICTNGAREALFWRWAPEAGQLGVFHPPNVLGRRQRVGAFTQTAFLPFTTRAVTGTVGGELVVWDLPSSDLQDGAAGRDAVKVVRPSERASGINTVAVSGKTIATGCADGAVRFYDFQYRVVGWFEHLAAGPVTAVSFAQSAVPLSAGTTVGQGGAGMQRLDVPPFVVATSNGRVLRLTGDQMGVPGAARRGQPLVAGFDGDATAVAAHPTQPFFCTGTSAGALTVRSLADKSAVASCAMPDGVSRLAYSPDGTLLAAGTDSGALHLLRGARAAEGGECLEPLHLFQTKGRVTALAFSPCGRQLAAADDDRCVALFRHSHADEDPAKPLTWVFVGRSRSHFRPVRGVRWTSDGRLFSVGEDCVLNEYDTDGSSIRGGLLLLASTRVDTDATTLGVLPVPAGAAGAAEALLTASDALKFKLWRVDGAAAGSPPEGSPEAGAVSERSQSARSVLTDAGCESDDGVPSSAGGESAAGEGDDLDGGGSDKGDAGDADEAAPSAAARCFRTSLAPAYGGAVTRMERASGGRVAAFAGSTKIVGLVQLPADGNPARSVAVIAHAGDVADLALTADGKYMLTAGGPDRTVALWSVSAEALEAAVAVSPPTPAPYVALLGGGEGGGEGGGFYQELVDYFCFAQLRAQGLDTTAPRKMTGRIPLDEVSNVARALGFFPSERQVRDMITEVRLGPGLIDGEWPAEPRDSVTLDEFVVLFANHRPAVPLRRGDFRLAFKRMGADDKSGLLRDRLIEVIMEHGEKMSEEEVAGCLDELLGLDGSAEESVMLPEHLKPESFAENVLGLVDGGV